MGKLFPDGSAIEQLRGNQLVLWHEGHGQIGPTADCGGQIYTAATLDPQMEQVLPLPAGSEDFGRAEDLITDLRGALTTFAGLDEDATLLVAIGTLGSWVADCLPGPLLVNPWGAAGTENALLDLMGCLCRRALRLADPSTYELASLPNGLAPTVILDRPSERALKRLVAAAGEPDTYFLSGGKVVHVHCPMIVCTRRPITLPALTIPLLPATRSVRRTTKSEAKILVDRFQPRLLHYRLVKHLDVANSQFDAPGFCPEARLLARVLGAAVEGSPDLQASMMDALRGLDEQRKGEQPHVAALVQALLALSHTQTPGAYVGAVTDLTNNLLENREEDIELSPRAVGEILRQELGLFARRRPLGYELALDLNTQRRVHRLAAAHNVLQPVADCPRCEEMLVSIPTENQSASGA